MQPEEVPEEVDSGFIPAIDLQEQDHETSTETESGSDESESDSSSFDYYSTFTDTESGSDSSSVEFPEPEGRNSEEEIVESQNIPLDELFDEELNGIGEFIGGLSENEISCCLHSYTFNSADSKNGIDCCVICQFEYEEGEAIAALIQCEHPYHRDCIGKWLRIRKVCPMCSSEVSSTPTITKNSDTDP